MVVRFAFGGDGWNRCPFGQRPKKRYRNNNAGIEMGKFAILVLCSIAFVGGCSFKSATPQVASGARSLVSGSPFINQNGNQSGWLEFTMYERVGPLAPGADGNMWTPMDGAVGRISMQGALTLFSHVGIGTYSPITTNPDGDIYIGESPEDGVIAVAQVTTDFQITDFTIPVSTMITGIASSFDGNLWVVGSTYLGRLSTTGQYTDFTPTGMQPPIAITRGPDKNIWVLTQGATLLRVSTSDGSVTSYALPFAGGLTAGYDALWTGSGTQLARIDTTGNVETFTVPRQQTPAAAGPNKNLYWITHNNEIVEYSQQQLRAHRVVTQSVGSGPTMVAGPDGQMWQTKNLFHVDVFIVHPLLPTPTSMSLSVGQQLTLSVTEPKSSQKVFTATSNASQIATVAGNGFSFTVTGVSAGSTSITISDAIGNSIDVPVTVQ